MYWILAIIIFILLLLGIPWYTKQLGRFFCFGFLEYLKEKTKGEKDVKKE